MSERLALAANETFRSLRVRNFRLFFVGQLVSRTGTWLTMVAQVLLVLELTDSAIALGLLTAFQFGPLLVLGAWAGVVADRMDKRRLLLWIQAWGMLQALALGVVVLSGQESVGVIYAFALAYGLMTAFDSPTRRAFVVEMVPPDGLPNAVSLNSAVMTGSRVIGPAIAGALVVTVGYGWTFFIDGVTFVAVLYALWRMRPEELYAEAPAARAAGQVRAGLRYIRSETLLFVPLVMVAMVGVVAFNFQVTVPLLVTGPLSGDESTFTLVFSVLSLGSLVGALWTARRHHVTSGQVTGSAVGFGVTMFALAAAPNLAGAFVASFALGAASVAFITASTSLVQALAAPEYRGRVLAIQIMVLLGSRPLGGPLVGAIAEAWGVRTSIAAGGVACLVAGLYGHRALARDDALLLEGDQPDEAVADDEVVTLTD